jgi:two-component system response regulator YesN
VEYKAPDFSLWQKFLKSGEYESVKKEAAKYLDRQNANNNLDKEALKKFITGMIQLLIGVLNENNIHNYKMGEALFNTDLINFSAQNVTNAKNGIGQMLDTVMYMLKNPDNDKPIVQTIKEYIDSNLDKELTREGLAERVYLNQDYLARIFKKEIGESIVNYITGKRIAVAKEYLEKTNESVNSVAIKVGYDNFSYFTKTFKDRVGMTPKDYRSIYGKMNMNAAAGQRNGD